MPDFVTPKRVIPSLNNITDLKTRQEIINAFESLYNYCEYKFKVELDKLRTNLLQTNVTDFAGGNLIADLGRRLIGSDINDPFVEEVSTAPGTITSITINVPAYMTGGGTDNTDPVNFNLGFSNQVASLFFASPSGGIGAVGFRAIAHADIANLDLLRTTSNADPALADLPNNGNASIHRNTVSGNVFLAYNDGGVILKVQLV
jgi:hypothetical protein